MAQSVGLTLAAAKLTQIVLQVLVLLVVFVQKEHVIIPPRILLLALLVPLPIMTPAILISVMVVDIVTWVH
jgi:hypothetical protein